jgi:CubicO group peptidase (beta-lactamase class C family)
MQEIQTPGSKDSGYGLGFDVRIGEGGIWMVGHEGMVAGYNAYIVFSPESAIEVVLLRNHTEGGTDMEQRANGLLRELVTVNKTADI